MSVKSLLQDPLDKLANIGEGEPTVDHLIQALGVTSEEAELIQIMTTGQRNNPLWMDARQWQITAGEGDLIFYLRTIHTQMSIIQYILLVLFLFVVEMDSLPRFGVSKELSHEEFSRRLRCANDLDIVKLRLSLFEDAKAIDLAHLNSQLVTRRKVGGGKSVVEKHAEGIWSLVCSIRIKIVYRMFF